MYKLLVALVLIFLSHTGCREKVVVVEWISSNPSSLWQISQVEGKYATLKTDSIICIFPEKQQQEIDGFGGCFNEMGWVALQSVTPEDKDNIFHALFDTLSGCKFNICRIPIGANDYAVDWYSLDETNDDFNMTGFSIERDKQRLIPYIRGAKAFNSGIKIWASPWCPPSWMKTNDHYACRPDKVNDLAETGRGEEMKTQFRMEERYLSAYALYFSKFIRAYQNEGIDIYAVHVQNEPNSCQNFPSCIWSPSALATFSGSYLGPQFIKDKVKAEIWLGTIERPQVERVDTILTNDEAKKYIKGVGFQWAGKGAISEVHKKYPDIRLMQTETECGDGSNDWKAAEHTFQLMKHYFNNGANAYMYWNMVLNETGKSQWGWKQNSMISIDSKNGTIKYNPEFYLMKHFSSFIKAGAFKIASSDDNCLAFRNPDSVTIVYYNAGVNKEKIFMIDDCQIMIDLPESSINTFRIKI